MRYLKLSALVFSTLLVACSNKSTNLTFDPPVLKDCNGFEVNVIWDVSIEHPNTRTIALYVNNGVNENLFAQGGSIGSAKTGPWARPGTRFILKDNETKQLLEEASIGGPACK